MTVAEEIGTGLLPTAHIRSTNLTIVNDSISFISTLSVKDAFDENNVLRWSGTIIEQLAKVTFVCVEVSTRGVNIDLVESLNNGEIMPMHVDGQAPGVTKITYPLSNFIFDLANFHITDEQFVYDVDFDTQTIPLANRAGFVDKVFIYACMHMDLEDAASSLGIVADFGSIENFSSVVTSEKLMDLGVPVTTTISLVTEDGLPYTGMAEPVGGESLTLESPVQFMTPTEAPLTQAAIPNQSLTITKVDMGVSQEELQTPTTSPFSEIFYSVDKNETLVGNFLFDPKSLIIENMEISSKMFSANPSEFEDIYASVDYKMMEIFRVEMKQGNQYLNDRDDVVVQTHNQNGAMFRSKSKYLFVNGLKANVNPLDLPEVLDGARIIDENNLSRQDLEEAEKVGSVEEVETSLGQQRFISFTDNRVGASERGEYTYGVRFLVSNIFDEHIRDRMRMLSMGISMADDYYKAAMLGQKFDATTGKIKTEYITTLKEAFTVDSETPWIEPVVRYGEAHKLLTETPLDLSPIVAALNPETATESSIKTIIDDMEATLNDLRDYYDISEIENKSESTSAKSSADSKGTNLVEFRFSEIINSSEMNRSGLQYFEQESNSVLKISKRNFDLRAQAEKNKFFKSKPNTNGNSELADLETNMYAYLTPSKIKTGATNISLNGSFESAQMEFINAAEPESPDADPTNSEPSTPTRSFQRTNNLRGRLAGKATSLGIILGKPAKKKKRSRKFTDARKVFGRESDFIASTKDYSPSVEETNEINAVQNDEILTAMSMDKKDLGSKTLSLKAFTKLPTIPEDVLNLPLQLKAIVLSGNKATTLQFGDSDPFINPKTRKTAEFNFTKIRQIEYLSGFEESNNLSMMKSPMWKILRKEDFDALEGNVICRMMPYSSDFYGTMDKDNLKDYDTMFIIEA